MKLLALFVITLAASISAQNFATDGVAVLMGGFGGGISLEVVELNRHCLGENADPFLPGAPGGSLEGWSAEYVDEKIFLCGGSNINQVSDCYSLTLGSSFWDYSNQMSDAREYGASIVFNGEMVVLGGYNDRNGWLDSVDRKTAGSTEWSRVDEWTMPRQLFNHCAAQKSANEIMVFAGNEYGNDYLDIVSVLDTSTGTWTDLDERLPSGRASLGCLTTTVNGVEGVMITGGCINDCIDHISEVLFYSFADGSWTELASLNAVRMGHKMTHVNGIPAVIGGYDDNLLTSAEFYENGEWRLVNNALEFGRWAYGMPSYMPMSLVDCGETASTEPPVGTGGTTEGDATTVPRETTTGGAGTTTGGAVTTGF